MRLTIFACLGRAEGLTDRNNVLANEARAGYEGLVVLMALLARTLRMRCAGWTCVDARCQELGGTR